MINQRFHGLPQHIKDLQFGFASLRQAKSDHRFRIEGIGSVLS